VPSDIEIAREAILKPIGDIAARLGIPPESVENYGRSLQGPAPNSWWWCAATS
jgi:formate--tetrahydrofolate ligase